MLSCEVVIASQKSQFTSITPLKGILKYFQEIKKNPVREFPPPDFLLFIEEDLFCLYELAQTNQFSCLKATDEVHAP